MANTTSNCDRGFLALNRKQMTADILQAYGPWPWNEEDTRDSTVWKCQKYLQLFDKPSLSYLGTKMPEEKLEDLFKVKFSLAITLLGSSSITDFNFTSGLTMLEDISQDCRCPQQIMDWTLYNYGHYTGLLEQHTAATKHSQHENQTIPKIVHMIFFGETSLEPQHVRSIISVLEHMCKPYVHRQNCECYKLYFHTCFDSEGPILRTNSAWQLFTSYDNFVVKQIEAPQEFDGFKMEYVQYKADIARINVLKEHGGVYIDCDILVTRAFDQLIDQTPDCHGIIPRFFVSEEGPRTEEQKRRAIPNEQVLNAFLACTRAHPLLDLWLEETKGRIREGEWAYHIRLNEFVWLQNPCSLAKYGIKVLESKHFFAHSWQNLPLWATDQKLEPKEGEYGYHMWNTISSKNGLKGASILPGAEYSEKTTYTDLAEAAILISTTESVQKRISALRVLREMGFSTKNIHICLSERHQNPVYGCRTAHVNAIKKAKDIGCGSVLIVEDDIGFNPKSLDPDGVKQLKLDVIPNDWDVLYLGGILTRVDALYGEHRTELKLDDTNSRTLAKWIAGQVWCNHAYIVKRHMFDVVVSAVSRMEKHFATNIDGLEASGGDSVWKGLCGEVNIDHIYANMLSTRNKLYLCADVPIIQVPELSRFDASFDWDVWSVKYTGQTDPFAGKNIQWETI
jgi:hypothetical protein